MRDYGFDTLGLATLVSYIDPANEPSIRVAQRNGMTRRFQAHKWEMDLGVHMITRAEWEALKAGASPVG